MKELNEYTCNGITYTVDGKNVVLDYSPHEKEIAELLAKEVGGEIFMVPRVNNPAGVSTPDYIFHGNPYDLKTLEPGATSNTIFNRVKKAHRQARNFIIDATRSGLSHEQILQQIEKIYWSNNTKFVHEMIIVRNLKM